MTLMVKLMQGIKKAEWKKIRGHKELALGGSSQAVVYTLIFLMLLIRLDRVIIVSFFPAITRKPLRACLSTFFSWKEV